VALTKPLLISPMRRVDIAAVHEIERLSFRTPWPKRAFEEEITANRLARYLVARAGGRIVAFAGIWMMAGDAHITTFGVHPGWRRQGIGRQLMLDVVELAESLGAVRMSLEVRESNEPAQSLYRAFGFRISGRRPRYYSDDGEDALIMTTPKLAGRVMRTILQRERAHAARAQR
jgi:[ribosomal protein S18]-alanine N-acetyltransferase